MEPRELKPGDVVQISGDTKSAFAGCFLLVTEPKSFGCMGFVSMPQGRGKLPGEAYYRPAWEEIEYIGRAAFVPMEDEEEEEDEEETEETYA